MAGTNSRCVLIAILLAVSGGAAHAQLRPEADAVAAAPELLLTRLRTDAYAYLRFVNRPWIERVCTVFAEEIRSMPKVRRPALMSPPARAKASSMAALSLVQFVLAG